MARSRYGHIGARMDISRTSRLSSGFKTKIVPRSEALVKSLAVLLLLSCKVVQAQTLANTASKAKLDPATKLDLINADVTWQGYRGRHALHVVPLPGHEHAVNEVMQVVLAESDFKDGTIEVDVAGARRQGYSTVADERGFKGVIGVSFRIQDQKAETFYVRPENSRLDDQLFRNRSTQYESMPDFPWNRLREESPGVYESYVDLEPGAWTTLRIEVSGTKARLYVNGAAQPCLIVNDLKQGYGHGKIALFTRVSTDAYFSNLVVNATP